MKLGTTGMEAVKHPRVRSPQRVGPPPDSVDMPVARIVADLRRCRIYNRGAARDDATMTTRVSSGQTPRSVIGIGLGVLSAATGCFAKGDCIGRSIGDCGKTGGTIVAECATADIRTFGAVVRIVVGKDTCREQVASANRGAPRVECGRAWRRV